MEQQEEGNFVLVDKKGSRSLRPSDQGRGRVMLRGGAAAAKAAMVDELQLQPLLQSVTR